mmetsp:Transcript_10156/g.9846  ORF Transcript_10156/g.9846 Transcript_10156/m.9846 type:complete len:419 (-) Transcript_10156:180-1436(-)
MISSQARQIIYFSAISLLTIVSVLYRKCDGSLSVTVPRIRICFHANEANSRGVAIATFDYANYAETILGYESFIIFPSLVNPLDNRSNEDTSFSTPRFQSRFNVSFYEPYPIGVSSGGYRLPQHALTIGCRVLYIAKSGEEESEPKFSTSYSCNMPTATLAIFKFEKHGFTYAVINSILIPSSTARLPFNRTMINNSNSVIPHIVRRSLLKAHTNLKSELNIPKGALTLCRHGGRTTFNTNFAHEAIGDLINKYNSTQLHFVFVNTDIFIRNYDIKRHGQIHFLPPMSSGSRRMESFFDTCDAMIHGRLDGEVFSLAIAEFSVRNKPVITCPGVNNGHIKLLGDKAYVYNNRKECINHITNFITNGIPERNYNAFTKYEPEAVMKAFDKIFLQPILSGHFKPYHLFNNCPKSLNSTNA